MAIEKDGPTDAHRTVLELLALEPPSSGRSEKMRLNPTSITRSTGYKNSSYIVRICRELEEEGLIEREEPGYYEITARGRVYLEGELTLD
ncbi:MarR family transcriptional regulator [Halorussus salinus]|uniref:MarR family transcriptional regulator n=1 Tax=Halorussus salinus TaxID=1364935 RepID=UPI0010919518|nr:MarR family transcriptional regulator [Halorussus salinus]